MNQGASVSQRLQAHDALVGIFEDQPDRRVWHRAALISGEHEDVALELEEAASPGESSRRRVPDARDQLTAQELQIAQMAAEGLSNREIGQKLFVSPRTVSTHLYRIYPKLGISARGELAPALEATS